MIWLDIGIIAGLCITTFFGLMTGLIKAVIDLVGMIIAVLLAGFLYPFLAKVLTFLPNESIANVVAFVLILVAVMIIFGTISRLPKKIAEKMPKFKLNWLNHLFGAIFGLAWGILGLGALLTAWITFTGITGNMNQSIFAKVLVDYIPMALALLPSQFDAVRVIFQ